MNVELYSDLHREYGPYFSSQREIELCIFHDLTREIAKKERRGALGRIDEDSPNFPDRKLKGFLG